MWVRATLAVAALGALFLPVCPAQAESLAGHWHLTFYGRCVLSAQNVQACAALQAPAWFAVYDRPGATLVVRGTGEYVADARGRYTVRFVTTISERVPGAAAPTRCDNSTVFDTVWTGTCREVGSGHGHIAPGATGMDDFWQDDTSGHWTGRPPVPFASGGPSDTMNPACPGTLGTAQFLRLFGIRHVPAGIQAKLILTHHRP